jgi:hypothetical protein
LFDELDVVGRFNGKGLLKGSECVVNLHVNLYPIITSLFYHVYNIRFVYLFLTQFSNTFVAYNPLHLLHIYILIN